MANLPQLRRQIVDVLNGLPEYVPDIEPVQDGGIVRNGADFSFSALKSILSALSYVKLNVQRIYSSLGEEAKLPDDLIEEGVRAHREALENAIDQVQHRLDAMNAQNLALQRDNWYLNNQVARAKSVAILSGMTLAMTLYSVGVNIIRSWWNGQHNEHVPADPATVTSSELRKSAITSTKIFTSYRVDQDGDVRTINATFVGGIEGFENNPNLNNTNVLLLVEEPFKKPDGTIKPASWASYVWFPFDYIFGNSSSIVPTPPPVSQTPDGKDSLFPPDGSSLTPTNPPSPPDPNPSPSGFSKYEPKDPSPTWISTINFYLISSCIVAGATWAFADGVKDWTYDNIKWMIVRTGWKEQISP